jgi:beta-glucosidase
MRRSATTRLAVPIRLSAAIGLLLIAHPVHAGEEHAPPPAYRNPQLSVDERVTDLLARMTLEEKARQMDMYAGEAVLEAGSLSLSKTAQVMGDLGMGSIHDLYPTSAETANAIQRCAVEQTRLGIPVLFIEEGLHGIVGAGHTVFPQAIGLASTWHRDLVQQIGAAIAAEARSVGIHEALGPVLDLAREPRWGRTEETYGEDAYLAARMGVAMVTGLQGTALNSPRSILAEPKHFAGHGIPEGGVNCAPVHVGERELRETFLSVFRAAIVEGGAQTVMSAYHEIDGIPCTGNRWLLQDVLRREWGFRGFVLSDLGAIRMLEGTHHTAATPQEAIRQAIEGGVDMQFYDYSHEIFQSAVVELVRDGRLRRAAVDRAVGGILRVKFLLGLFDQPYTDPALAAPVMHCARHVELALQAARESVCLLKNDRQILPLPKNIRSIAVIGPSADVPRLGDYTNEKRNAVTVLAGIRSCVSPATEVVFRPGTEFLGEELVPVPTACLRLPDGSGPGLQAEYFDNTDLAGTPRVVRVDPEVNFKWGSAAPHPDLAADRFSVRWTGKLVPEVTVDGRLGATSDDGVRLWIDDQLIVEEWSEHNPLTRSRPFHFEAGRAYALRMEYCEITGGALVQLGWDATDRAKVNRELCDLAAKSDVVVAVVGESDTTVGEGFDRADLDLPGAQLDLIQAVQAAGKPVVVVLLNGRPLSVPWLAENVPAIVEAWFPGEQGGTAVAEVLFGDTNPAGRLPVTVPKFVGQVPMYYDYKPSARRPYVKIDAAPLYPFGHGLSYTEFAYRDLTVSPEQIGPDGSVTVSVTVANTGARAGDEVVQLYVHDEVASVTAPVKRLRGFERIHLTPQQTQRVTFTLGPADLAVLDRSLKPVVEPGRFEVFVGGSSAATLSARFEVTGP